MNGNYSFQESPLEFLHESLLMSTYYDPFDGNLCLYFSFGPDESEVMVHLQNVIYSSFHRMLNEDSRDSFIGEAYVSQLTDGGLEVLADVQFPFTDIHSHLITFPNVTLYYFRLEGSITIRVLCAGFQVFFPANRSLSVNIHASKGG